MAFITQFFLLITLLTCSQEAQVIALPPYNATGFFPTSISRKTSIQSTCKNTSTTQYPPTTTVQNTTPGTKGVSGFSFPSSGKYGCLHAFVTKWGANMNQIIVTSLETQGRPSIEPFPTYTPPPIILTTAFPRNLSLITDSFQSSIVVSSKVTNNSNVSTLSKSHLPSSKMDRRGVIDCFQPVATGALPSQLPSRGDHPVQRLGIVSPTYP